MKLELRKNDFGEMRFVYVACEPERENK